jgi:4-amino-4-deoxy-L-arabinose transferase-like glycosyltransferase
MFAVFDKVGLRKLLSENYPLLIILIGIVLVSVSVGPFQNWDTQKEYQAASGVIKWGMPYVGSFGVLMDEPPLGYYVEALFQQVFGSSIVTGVTLITLFGFGCTVLVYEIGKVWFNKNTGLLAAVLFALTPWEFVLSRSFLMDVPCLFFSLLSLFVGILAIRKDSFKLLMVSGTLFAAAFLTKFYAVFALIPLSLFYFRYGQPRRLRRTVCWFVAFSLPTIFLAFLWYQTITGQGLLSILSHGDFEGNVPAGVIPSYLFVVNFLSLYGLGWFFLIAAVLSLVVGFLARKRFSGILVFDLISLVTAISVVSVNTFLGAYLKLNIPYMFAIKYDYQALPFFSLLAASLGNKCFSLLNSARPRIGVNKLLFSSVALTGAVLLSTAIFVNIYHVHLYSTSNYLLFSVEWGSRLGFSILNPAVLIDKPSFLMGCQYLGFALTLAGLALALTKSVNPKNLDLKTML